MHLCLTDYTWIQLQLQNRNKSKIESIHVWKQFID